MKKSQIKWKKLIQKEIIQFSRFPKNKFLNKIGKMDKIIICIKVT